MSKLNNSFFIQAMQKLSLFRPTKKARVLLESLSEVTGFSLPTLMYVERCMTSQESLQPLKTLLNSEKLSGANRLQYKIGITRHLGPKHPTTESVKNVFKLSIQTDRGNVDVLIKVRAKRSIMEFENERQSASVEINYRIRSKSALRRFKQTLQLSGIAPSMPQTQFTKPKSQFTHAA
jgi:hypothetical protein